MNRSNRAICLLNAESAPFIDKYFNTIDADVYCFDSISGQCVKMIYKSCTDISEEFKYNDGFISAQRVNQFKCLYFNYKIFEKYLVGYKEVVFTFENVFVRIFSIKNKSINTLIVLDKLIHPKNSALKQKGNPYIKNFFKVYDRIYKNFRGTLFGAILPGQHGTAKVSKYVVSDSFTVESIKPNLLNNVDLDLIPDLKFPQDWISNDREGSIVFICSAWKHHLKEKEHLQQLNDIKILSRNTKHSIIVKLHPRDRMDYYDELKKIDNIRIGFFDWKEILGKKYIYFSNLSTCLIELYNSNLNAYSIMISFNLKNYQNALIADKRISVVGSIEKLKEIINES